MATTQAQLINSICTTKDIGCALSQPNIDDMMGGYEDIWGHLRAYYTKFRSVPDIDVIEEKFPDFEPTPAKGETQYVVEKLKEEYLNHRLEQITTALKENTGRLPSSKVIGNSVNALLKLNNMSVGTSELDVTDFKSAAERYRQVRIKAEENGGTPGIPTGVDFIDSSYTAGLSGGDLVIILGWTGRAKSLFTTLVSCNAFRKGYKPMIVSLEMSKEKVQDRIYTIMGNGIFANSDLTMGYVDEDDFRSWSKTAKKDAGSSFTVVSHDGVNDVTPALIQSKIDQHKPDILVLDYAQLMTDNANSNDMTARMRNMSREYKSLAQANDIPIILISSATPDSSASISGPPIVEQVAWSKQLAFDADLAIAVHKHDGSDGIIEIACRKNRNGELFAGYFKADINRGIYDTYESLEDIPMQF